ncbi:MAG: hypothetical protein EA397_17220 [Deltaproteobacteria bacterium]|nr:MAG: hypothetical protein EA397_17220 [Deltaproteobacteria bacterium]
MTRPNGERSAGYLKFEEVDPPRSSTVRDGLLDEDGSPNEGLPNTTMRVEFSSTSTGSRFVATSTFATLDDLEKLVGTDMIEGRHAAIGQLDATFDDPEATALDGPTTLEVALEG